jgi:hypothetical protein
LTLQETDANVFAVFASQSVGCKAIKLVFGNLRAAVQLDTVCVYFVGQNAAVEEK